jgi:hypothetical protein
MTELQSGEKTGGGGDMPGPYDDVADNGAGPIPEINSGDSDVRTCAKEGCSNTFTLSNTFFGQKRKYCDDHKTTKRLTPPKVSRGTSTVKQESGADSPPAGAPGERKPGSEKQSVGARLGFSKGGAGPRAGSGPRVRTADWWGDGVAGLGTLMAKTEFVPLGRCMTVTSPIAGEIIEDVTKGGIVDKLVQPVVRSRRKYEDMFDLFGLWAAVGYAQQNPRQAEQAIRFAKSRLIKLLPRIGKQIVKKQKEERAAVDAIAEVMPELMEFAAEMGVPGDPVEALLRGFFAPPEDVDTREPEEAVA